MNASSSRPSAIVTGSGGLALEIAKRLAAAGFAITLAARDARKAEAAMAAVRGAAPSVTIDFEPLDLADLASIARFAARMADGRDRLDLLVNNAGVMSPPARRVTADGFELQLGTNHLGHFALTLRLLPLLAAADAARVVSVTSLALHSGRIDFDDPQSERRYRAGVAYCQSKLAQAVFAVELQRRADRAGLGLLSLAAHPGLAATGLFDNSGAGSGFVNVVTKRVAMPLLGQSAGYGALPVVHAATSPAVIGGRLYGPTGRMKMRGPPGENALPAKVTDPALGERLWSVSERLVDLRFPS